MTENEIQDIEREVDSGAPVDPIIERSWAMENLSLMRIEEQRLMASFRLWKHMRDDGKIQEIQQLLRRTRSIIKYLCELTHGVQ